MATEHKAAQKCPSTSSSPVAIQLSTVNEESENECIEPKAIEGTVISTFIWKHFVKSESFCSRISALIVLQFLAILSLGYTLSQIYTVELTDYWCETKTLEEIHQHSINIGSQTGDSGCCWTSKNSIVTRL